MRKLSYLLFCFVLIFHDAEAVMKKSKIINRLSDTYCEDVLKKTKFYQQRNLAHTCQGSVGIKDGKFCLFDNEQYSVAFIEETCRSILTVEHIHFKKTGQKLLLDLEAKKPRTFSLDREANTFRLDGEPFRFISGSIHNFRIPSAYWDDRFKKIRAGGYNAVQIYIEWSLHEPSPGEFNFSGENDLEKFIQTAQDNDLFVILRPGPFMDAERDMGGLPFWLLQKYPDIKLRTNDPRFMGYVDRYLKTLYGRLSRFLIENGGPIIMVQVENEYGSYVLQTNFYDIDYISTIRDMARKYLNSNKVVLFTVDGCGSDYLRSGRVPEVYSSVDFGVNYNMTACFQYQKLFEPKGPLINPEFYTGWLDHWSEPHQTVATEVFAQALDFVLSKGANINMYMVTGGTNFGFSAGANHPPFRPNPTSYDYDAPINESGDLTEKYFAIRDVIRKYFPIPSIPVNNFTEKGHYGTIHLKPVSSLIHEPHIFTELKASSPYPLSFEALGQNQGFVLYETLIQDNFSDPALLEIPGMHDRGYVFVDSEPQGILSRMYDIYSLPIRVRAKQLLQVVVENQGRICYGPNINDFKGIVSNVTIGGRLIRQWKMAGIPLSDGRRLQRVIKAKQELEVEGESRLYHELSLTQGSMSFWIGSFATENCSEPARDTFARLDGWRKGVLFVNGFNVGRYWPTEGPQVTLFVPATFLMGQCKTNTVIVFEQDRAPCLGNDIVKPRCSIKFVTEHVVNGPTPVQPSSFQNLQIRN